MRETLRLLIPAFAGEQQGKPPLTLSGAYAAKGSRNVYFDILGRLKPIGGQTLRTDDGEELALTSAALAAIRALYLYRKYTVISGTTYGSTKFGAGLYGASSAVTDLVRQLLVWGYNSVTSEAELHLSENFGQTFELVKAFSAGSKGTVPCFGLMGDKLYITDGVIAPQVWDGDTAEDVGGTQLAAPTLAAGDDGTLNGVYRYRLMPILDDGTRKIASVQSSALAVENTSIDLTWTADTDTDVQGYELWRTTGSGLDFYLVAYIEGLSTVAYTDDLPDTDLLQKPALTVTAAHGDTPLTGTFFCVPHGGRMWWLRTTELPRRAWHSDPGVPDSIYTERNYIECNDAETFGDALRGGTGEFKGMLVLWFSRVVWTISGTGQIVNGVIDFIPRRSEARTGTVSVRTVAKAAAGSVYLDTLGEAQSLRDERLVYLTPLHDIRLFDGQGDTVISGAVAETLARINPQASDKAYVYDDELAGMLVWVFPTETNTVPNLAVGWNYKYGTWHVLDPYPLGHIISAEISGDELILLGGSAGPEGVVFQVMAGIEQTDGEPVFAEWVTVPLYPPAEAGGPPNLGLQKRFIAAHLLYTKVPSPENLQLEALTPDWVSGDTLVQRTTLCQRAHNGSQRKRIPLRINAAFRSALAAASVQILREGQYVHQEGIRLRLTSILAEEGWLLQGLELEYQVLGDVKV